MRRLALAALLLVAAVSSASAALLNTGWPQFRGGPQLASSMTVTGSVLTHPRIKWRLTLPKNVFSSGLGERGLPDGPSGSVSNQRTRASVSIGTNGMLFAPYGLTIVAVNSVSGAVVWVATGPAATMLNGGSAGFTQPVVLSTNVAGVPTELVITSSANSIVAFRADTGAPVWQVNPDPVFAGRAPGTAGTDGKVYFGNNGQGASLGGGNAVYALNSANGTVAWSFPTGGLGPAGPVALSPDQTKAYFVAGSGLYVLNSANGVMISSQSLGDNGYNQRAVTVNSDGTVFAYHYDAATLPNAGHTLVRFTGDLQAGTTVWVGAHVWGGCCLGAYTLRDAPTLNGNSVFVMDNFFNNELSALGIAGGASLWNQSDSFYSYPSPKDPVTNPGSGGFPNIDSPPTHVGNSDSYLMDGSGALVHFDPATGTVKWKLQFTNYGSGFPGQIAQAAQDEAGQIAFSTGGTAYVLWAANTGDPGERQLVAIEESGAVTLAVSSAPATVVGSSWIATIGVQMTDAGALPVPNAPVEATSVTDTQGGFAMIPSSRTAARADTDYMYTSAAGSATFVVSIRLDQEPHANWGVHTATVTVGPPGFPGVPVVIQDLRASTFTITISTPSIVDNGDTIVRITTVTFTVSNSTGGRVMNYPVALDCAGCSLVTPATFQVTDSTGQARIVIQRTMNFSGNGDAGNMANFFSNTDAYGNLHLSLTAYAYGLPPVTAEATESRISTYTFSLSSAVIQSDVRASTLTVTAYDVSGSTVPNAIIALQYNVWSSSGPTRFFFKSHASNLTPNFYPAGEPTNSFIGYTDAFGQATFFITLNAAGFPEFDSFGDTPFPVRIYAFGRPVSVSTPTANLLLESNFLSSYTVTAATNSFIGAPFVSTVTALNANNHRLAAYNESGVTLTPLFANSIVQGSGALGTSNLSFSGSSGQVVISSQTYNKIENIQIKATRGSGSIKTGLSGTLVMLGPVRYVVSVPTSAPAGGVFGATITAVDSGNNPVIGYGATLSLTPVVALATGTPATGNLTPATVNLPANGTVFVNNLSYSKGDSIQIKVNDSALSISGFSSSMTITQPPLVIDHYHFTAPQSVTVGSPFSVQVEAMDASSAPVSYSLGRTLNIQAFLAGTSIAGSGSLGVPTQTLASGSTFTFTASQTYNKIEAIQLKVTDDDGRVGLSSYTITFTGPTQFIVAVATSAKAGVPFQFVVQAQDAGNSQVLGYNGTVNVAAVDATTTTLSGGGILGVTSLNLSGGAGSSAFQSYTKAQGIRFRVSDSGIGVTTISSSMTIVAGPAATLTLAANPQSTIATVPSVLTAQAADAFNNPIAGSTVTFTVASGSAVVTLGLVNGGVPGSAGVVSTQAPTGVSGSATAFFGSTTTQFSQGDLVIASVGGLTATTTIYNAVVLSNAGGVVANQATPLLSVTCPASTWGFPVRMSIAGRSELSAADLALTTAAFAASANTFVSTTVMRVDVTRDASPGTLAGAGGKLVSVALPFTSAGGNVTVGGFRGQSLLVPLSVLRVFKLNKQTSIFEMVLDGVNLPQGNGTVSAQVSDPEGIFALGVPPYATLGGTSSGTVTAALASGALATVTVPFGAFASATTLTVSPLSLSSLPALPAGLNLTATGIAISINTNGVQPASPVGVSLGYTAAAIAGLDPTQLRVARYDAGVGWRVLESQVDTAAGTVIAQTDGFSLFAIVAAAPSSSVGSGFVFPNPFRPSLGHLNIKFAGLPAAAHIKIYTVSGRLLKELDADSTGSVLNWNGTDKDGRPLASGVYLAIASDSSGGGGKATIKFAVQR